ncbi:uncharacterized protein EDB91DRAFT_1078307 [Suillus paluster]|uniref:uncharacterized protein n=1 Tax=Suillus paluster TaxID=48578 RepID=UPI001B87DA81|nr:uncharacterized protein EDB91DRAFT_1078307 [Suillus paluster]KAG1751545.1 hypothetical protein EDB91DRAFT_1078307 [Suillus paluster]
MSDSVHLSRFPISSIRPDGPQNTPSVPPHTPPKPVFPRYDPLHVLCREPTPPPPTKQSFESIVHTLQVAPGILANGVLTVMLPAVREFLSAAARAPPAAPELPSDTRVLALAALAVFYRPLHPAHWVFWNKEQKKRTAAVVQSVLDTTPTPIISPIGWIATQDNLWILGSLQHAYSSALSSQPWYTAYVPSESETRMSLRKRKPTLLQEQALEDDDDELLALPPPRKRAKTRRTATAARSPRKPEESSLPDKAEPEEVPDEVEAGNALLEPEMDIMLTRAAKRELIEAPVLAQEAEKSVSPEPRRSQRKKGDSPASSATTLTRTHSRELSMESVEGAESAGSSTVCEEEPDKEKEKKGRVDKAVKRLDKNEEEGDDEEIEEKKPAPAKRPRASASRAKPRSRAAPKKTTNTNTSPEEDAENADDTPAPPAPKPKSRSRPRTRRR